MKKIIENIAVRCLYNHRFIRHGRINKKKKKIIFIALMGVELYKFGASPKEELAMSFLINYCGYKTYQEKMCWLVPLKPKFEHTLGEIQDIIRAGNKNVIRIPQPRCLEMWEV